MFYQIQFQKPTIKSFITPQLFFNHKLLPVLSLHPASLEQNKTMYGTLVEQHMLCVMCAYSHYLDAFKHEKKTFLYIYVYRCEC